MNEKKRKPLIAKFPACFRSPVSHGRRDVDTPVDAINGRSWVRRSRWGVSGFEDGLGVGPGLHADRSADYVVVAGSRSHPKHSHCSPVLAPWSMDQIARDCEFAIPVIPEPDGLLTKGISRCERAGLEVLAPMARPSVCRPINGRSAKWLHHEGIAHPIRGRSIGNGGGGAMVDKHRSHPLFTQSPSPTARRFSLARGRHGFQRGFPENGYLN